MWSWIRQEGLKERKICISSPNAGDIISLYGTLLRRMENPKESSERGLNKEDDMLFFAVTSEHCYPVKIDMKGLIYVSVISAGLRDY